MRRCTSLSTTWSPASTRRLNHTHVHPVLTVPVHVANHVPEGHVMFDHSVVEQATTWKAKVYPEFEKLTVGEFNRMAGFRHIPNSLNGDFACLTSCVV